MKNIFARGLRLPIWMRYAFWGSLFVHAVMFIKIGVMIAVEATVLSGGSDILSRPLVEHIANIIIPLLLVSMLSFGSNSFIVILSTLSLGLIGEFRNKTPRREMAKRLVQNVLISIPMLLVSLILLLKLYALLLSTVWLPTIE